MESQASLFDQNAELPDPLAGETDTHNNFSSAAFLHDDLDFQDCDELDDNDFADNELVPVIEVVRSKRRKKSVGAYRQGNKTIVTVPHRMAQRDIDDYVRELVERLDKRDARSANPDFLYERAREMMNVYLQTDLFARGDIQLKWVTNQNSRWGSCTPQTRVIRLSHRLQLMPVWVLDCVILHELAHLIEANHNAAFYELVNRHPEYEKSNAYLSGFQLAQGHYSHSAE